MPYKLVKKGSLCRVRSASKRDGKYKYFSKKGIPCSRALRQMRILYMVENRMLANKKSKRSKTSKRKSTRRSKSKR